MYMYILQRFKNMKFETLFKRLVCNIQLPEHSYRYCGKNWSNICNATRFVLYILDMIYIIHGIYDTSAE